MLLNHDRVDTKCPPRPTFVREERVIGQGCHKKKHQSRGRRHGRGRAERQTRQESSSVIHDDYEDIVDKSFFHTEKGGTMHKTEHAHFQSAPLFSWDEPVSVSRHADSAPVLCKSSFERPDVHVRHNVSTDATETSLRQTGGELMVDFDIGEDEFFQPSSSPSSKTPAKSLGKSNVTPESELQVDFVPDTIAEIEKRDGDIERAVIGKMEMHTPSGVTIDRASKTRSSLASLSDFDKRVPRQRNTTVTKTNGGSQDKQTALTIAESIRMQGRGKVFYNSSTIKENNEQVEFMDNNDTSGEMFYLIPQRNGIKMIPVKLATQTIAHASAPDYDPTKRRARGDFEMPKLVGVIQDPSDESGVISDIIPSFKDQPTERFVLCPQKVKMTTGKRKVKTKYSVMKITYEQVKDDHILAKIFSQLNDPSSNRSETSVRNGLDHLLSSKTPVKLERTDLTTGFAVEKYIPSASDSNNISWKDRRFYLDEKDYEIIEEFLRRPMPFKEGVDAAGQPEIIPYEEVDVFEYLKRQGVPNADLFSRFLLRFHNARLMSLVQRVDKYISENKVDESIIKEWVDDFSLEIKTIYETTVAKTLNNRIDVVAVVGYTSDRILRSAIETSTRVLKLIFEKEIKGNITPEETWIEDKITTPTKIKIREMSRSETSTKEEEEEDGESDDDDVVQRLDFSNGDQSYDSFIESEPTTKSEPILTNISRRVSDFFGRPSENVGISPELDTILNSKGNKDMPLSLSLAPLSGKTNDDYAFMNIRLAYYRVKAKTITIPYLVSFDLSTGRRELMVIDSLANVLNMSKEKIVQLDLYVLYSDPIVQSGEGVLIYKQEVGQLYEDITMKNFVGRLLAMVDEQGVSAYENIRAANLLFVFDFFRLSANDDALKTAHKNVARIGTTRQHKSSETSSFPHGSSNASQIDDRTSSPLSSSSQPDVSKSMNDPSKDMGVDFNTYMADDF